MRCGWVKGVGIGTVRGKREESSAMSEEEEFGSDILDKECQ